MTSRTHGGPEEGPEALGTPQRVLAIGAHPDDIEFGAGATLARWAAQRSHIVMAVVTDGSKGTWDPRQEPAAVAATRKEEQAAAAKVLGAAEVAHLGYIDGELENTMELRSTIARLIREHRPDVVLSHDPWKRYQIHPDHRATGMGVVDGVVAARDPLYFPEHGLDAHRPGALLLWSAEEPDHAEWATDDAMRAKIEALLCHRSQAKPTMGIGADDEEERRAFGSRVRAEAKRAGEPFGAESAETFKRLTP